jgi:hypothetical protein
MKDDRTCAFSTIILRPVATNLSGGNASDTSATVFNVNLTADLARFIAPAGRRFVSKMLVSPCTCPGIHRQAIYCNEKQICYLLVALIGRPAPESSRCSCEFGSTSFCATASIDPLQASCVAFRSRASLEGLEMASIACKDAASARSCYHRAF